MMLYAPYMTCGFRSFGRVFQAITQAKTPVAVAQKNLSLPYPRERRALLQTSASAVLVW